jgi:hypothetical protein
MQTGKSEEEIKNAIDFPEEEEACREEAMLGYC